MLISPSRTSASAKVVVKAAQQSIAALGLGERCVVVRADLEPAEIFKAHIKQSKENSLKARVARAADSLPGAMEKGLDLDYKHNLY